MSKEATLDEVLQYGPIVAHDSELGLYVTSSFNQFIIWAGNSTFARVASVTWERTSLTTLTEIQRAARKFMHNLEVYHG